MKINIPDNWLPTPDSINSLPEPLKRYIHNLVSFSGAELVQENFELQENFKGATALMIIYRDELKEIYDIFKNITNGKGTISHSINI